MSQTPSNLLWTKPEWIEQVHSWINQSLVNAGFTLTGSIDQIHVRIWSTVMRMPTDSGILYFKACQPPIEAHMTQFLSSIQPENVPELVAVDLMRGWLLMRDAGPMLRTFLKSPDDLRMIEPALVQFAQLQIAASKLPPEKFISLGARERRLNLLPGIFESMLADMEILRIGKEDGLTVEQHEQLIALLPRYQEMCLQLQGYNVPQTLHHDDFHDGNIFISGQPGHYRFVFSDWEESAVAHPFFSMMLCLRSVASRAGFPDEATEAPDRMPQELNHLRDIYLQSWQQYERQDTLVDIFNLAWRVGMVSRAQTWREFVSSLPGPMRADFTFFVPAWLQEFLLAMK